MSGKTKFLIGEQNAEEILEACEYEADFTDIYYPTGSTDVTYDVDDLITKVVYYRNATQTNSNRIAQIDVTYNASCQPTTVVNTYYNNTDGTILLKTVTNTYTWSGDELDNIVTVHT